MTNTPDLLNEDDVRALLNGTPAPQVGVDLEAAMRTGRRMSARRGAAGVSSGVAAVVLVAALVVAWRADAPRRQETGPATGSSASASTSTPGSVNDIKLRCPMTPLATPAGAAGLQIDAVDPSGRYVGGHAVGDNEIFKSVMWVDGVPQYLDFAAGVYIRSINSHGVAVGDATDSAATGWSFRYADGLATKLQVPDGWSMFSNVTINERGDVAGTIKPDDWPESGSRKGIVWKAGSTSPTLVPLPSHAQVYGITADNRLLGNIGDGKSKEVYIWDMAGNETKLPRPEGFPVAPEATAGIYATGTLTGRGFIPRWDITTNQLTKIPSVQDGSFSPVGRHISATGWIIDGGQVAYRPDSTPVRMTAPGANRVESAGVTDNGDVFGTYSDPSRKKESYTPAVWHCGSAA